MEEAPGPEGKEAPEPEEEEAPELGEEEVPEWQEEEETETELTNSDLLQGVSRQTGHVETLYFIKYEC